MEITIDTQNCTITDGTKRHTMHFDVSSGLGINGYFINPFGEGRWGAVPESIRPEFIRALAEQVYPMFCEYKDLAAAANTNDEVKAMYSKRTRVEEAAMKVAKTFKDR